MKFEELSDRIESNIGNLFLVNLTAYLKIYGVEVLRNILKAMLSKSISGHVIIITYQCRSFWKFTDSRYAERGQINIVDGEQDEPASICMIAPSLASAFSNTYVGFEKIGEAFETSADKNIYIATNVDKEMFNMSLINISHLSNGYDLLCSKDERIKRIPESCGESGQWTNLLKAMGTMDFSYVVENQFGSTVTLVDCVKQYPTYADEKKWMYYVALLILGGKKNSYVNNVISGMNKVIAIANPKGGVGIMYARNVGIGRDYCFVAERYI